MNHLFVTLPPGFETRMKILHSVDAPIADITVGDICEKASISRQTFYKYFDSKYDISFWYVLFCDELTLTEVGRTQSWQDGLFGFFSLLRKEHGFFQYSARNGYPESSDRANRHRSAILKESLTNYRKVEISDDLVFYIEAFASLFNDCVGDWFRSEMHRSPEDMTRLIKNCVPRPLYEALDIETTEQNI